MRPAQKRTAKKAEKPARNAHVTAMAVNVASVVAGVNVAVNVRTARHVSNSNPWKGFHRLHLSKIARQPPWNLHQLLHIM